MLTQRDTLIDQVIEEAAKKFIPGSDINKDLRERVKRDPQLAESLHESEPLNFYQKKDADFPSYNANKIKGTHFVAAAGPQHSDAAAEFLKSTAFNEKLHIKEIIALGSILGFGKSSRTTLDFFDYGCGETSEVIFTKTKVLCMKRNNQVFDKLYNIEVKPQIYFGELLTCAHQERRPSCIVQTRLHLTLRDLKGDKKEEAPTRNVNVTILGVGLDYTIDLGFPDRMIEVVWELFKKSLSEPIVIHCDAGVGRTGELILTYELLKKYHEIFSSQDPVQIARMILEVLDQIRVNRPALIFKPEQFKNAIKNADILYRFALKKGYIKAGLSVESQLNENRAGTEGPVSEVKSSSTGTVVSKLAISPKALQPDSSKQSTENERKDATVIGNNMTLSEPLKVNAELPATVSQQGNRSEEENGHPLVAQTRGF